MTKYTSKILDFYINDLPNDEGITLKQMINSSDWDLEKSHTWIQWLFPLHETSRHNFNGPVLTEEDIKILQSSDKATTNILSCLERFRLFYGIGNHWNVDKQSWCAFRNHNLLRITRIIRSLRLFGLRKESFVFYSEAEIVARANVSQVGEETLDFWRRAYCNPVMQTMLK